MYGIAFDMGTTTLEAALVELESAKVCGILRERGDAKRFGADVMSRLTVALRGEESQRQIQNAIITQMDTMIGRLSYNKGILPEEISGVTLAGNTVMMHLTLGLSVDSLGKAPFVSQYKGCKETTAGSLGLYELRKETSVLGLPVVKEHVGADALSGMIYLGMDYKNETILFIDIGTNGEIALCRDGQVYVCSTAAGPVFEGAGIRGGRVAGPGVITHVELANGAIGLQTYGAARADVGEIPYMYGKENGGDCDRKKVGVRAAEDASSCQRIQGICGSGVMDAIAVLLEAGLLSPEGMLYSEEELKQKGVDYALQRQVVSTPEGREAVLHTGNEKILAAAKGNPALFLSMREQDDSYVAIDQKSVRNFQLGKSAIRTGIDILLETADVRPEELDRVYLAGAFGDVLRLSSARKLGLWPEIPENRIRPVGNAALKGAVQALCSEEIRMRFQDLAVRANHVSLANHPVFEKCFVENMNFPA